MLEVQYNYNTNYSNVVDLEPPLTLYVGKQCTQQGFEYLLEAHCCQLRLRVVRKCRDVGTRGQGEACPPPIFRQISLPYLNQEGWADYALTLLLPPPPTFSDLQTFLKCIYLSL